MSPTGLSENVVFKQFSACNFQGIIHNTYCLLTPYSRVLLEKLTGSQLVKKSPAFYGTRMFITALPSANHLTLS
jgi:hypothetical protein